MSTPDEDARRADLVVDDAVLVERSPEERAARREARERRRERRRLRARTRRIRRVAVAVLLALAVLATVVFLWFRYTLGGLDRIPGTLPDGPADTPGTTILLVGSDPGAHEGIGGSEAWRRQLEHSDLVMLVHLPADRSALYAVSLPGTTLLRLPDGPGHLGDSGSSTDYVGTVQSVTGARVDRLAVLDLNGVRSVVDHLGGVEVVVPAAGCGAEAGRTRVDGQSALELVRLRPCLPNGDLDRVARQQALFKGMLAALVDGTLTNPLALNRITKSTFDHLAVNQDWSLWEMAGVAWSLRGTTPRTTTFLTVPTRRTASGELTLAPQRAADLWQALRADRVGEYVALNRDTVAGAG